MVRQTSLAGQPIRKREEAGVQEDGLVKGGYKIESSYVTIRKRRGTPAPGAPMVSTPMGRVWCHAYTRFLPLQPGVQPNQISPRHHQYCGAI